MIDAKTRCLFMILALSSLNAGAARCLYVSSYHIGYAWSDGIERGVYKTLGKQCETTSFYMDTKRHKDEVSKKNAALEAKLLIEKIKPDVVIAADDNASKYLVAPYYKNAELPFVFCGINWTVEAYGYPYNNATGMIEVAAIEPLFQKALAITGEIRQAYYIGANTLTEEKEYERFKMVAKKHRIHTIKRLANTTRAWESAYIEAQKSDLIIIGSNAGITDWNESDIAKTLLKHTKVFSVTTSDWMMPFTMLGLTKVPEEQGEWSAKVALEIIKGVSPSQIPIIPNRKFNIVINSNLFSAAKIRIPESIKLKAQYL